MVETLAHVAAHTITHSNVMVCETKTSTTDDGTKRWLDKKITARSGINTPLIQLQPERARARETVSSQSVSRTNDPSLWIPSVFHTTCATKKQRNRDNSNRLTYTTTVCQSCVPLKQKSTEWVSSWLDHPPLSLSSREAARPTWSESFEILPPLTTIP